MAIKEMQRLKEKYPVYAEYSDESLLGAITKKYPQYRELGAKEFGEIRRPSKFAEALSEFRMKTPAYISEEEKAERKEYIGKFIERDIEKKTAGAKFIQRNVFDRPFGAMNALWAGKSPVEGFISPEKMPRTVDSFRLANFAGQYGVDVEKDPASAAWIEGMGATVADVFNMYVLFHAIPKALTDTTKAIKGVYGGAQGKAITELKSVMVAELEGAGMNKASATKLADISVAKGWEQVPSRYKSPGQIRRATQFIKDNKGMAAKAAKEHAAQTEANMRGQGVSKEWMKKAIEQTEAPVISKVEVTPKALPTEVSKARFMEVRAIELSNLAAKKFPFDATFMNEKVQVLGAADDFEPYKTSAKGKRDVTQLMAKRADGTNVIMMASHLKVGGKPLVTPTPKHLLGKPWSPIAPKGEGIEAEAKKFKTAEEFVESKKVVFHGTNKEFEEFNIAGEVSPYKRESVGPHFGTKEQAEFVAKAKGGKAKEFYLDIKNPIRLEDRNSWSHSGINSQLLEKGIITREEYDANVYKKETYDVRKILKEKGYDGIVYANTAEGKGDSYIAFDNSQIKTKSQLTDIWNKAQGKPEEAPAISKLKVARALKLTKEAQKQLGPGDELRDYGPLAEALERMSPKEIGMYRDSLAPSKKIQPTPEGEPKVSPELKEKIDIAETKIISRFPQKVMDTKSLKDVGDAMAKHLDLGGNIIWRFKRLDRVAVNGKHMSYDAQNEFGKDEMSRLYGAGPGDNVIEIAVGRGKARLREGWRTGGRAIKPGDPLYGKVMTTNQGRIKKVILHELWHIKHPPVVRPGGSRDVHFGGKFYDEVDKARQTVLFDRKVITKAPIHFSEMPPVVKGKYDAGSTFNVDYRTPEGIASTAMTGGELNALEQSLSKNIAPMDSTGKPMLSIMEAIGIKGEAGYINMSIFDDAITNMEGFIEEKKAGFSYFAKKFGTPFFMGEKYPPFKPIYDAVRDSVGQGQELSYTGLHILSPKFLHALPEHSKQRVMDALKLGNAQKKEFPEAELRARFGFDDNEVRGYSNVRRMYRYDTNVAIKRRKLAGGYDKLDPEAKAKADAHIEKEVKKFDGYVSQTRLGGKWATFIEVEDANSPDFPYFFNLHPNKASALKEARLKGGGPGNVYLRRDLKPDIYGRMSITDLENLADAAGVESDSPDLKALVGEIQKRSFSAHWIKRMDRPGYDWTMDNVIASAIDYNQGATSGFARATGKQAANRAYVESMKQMTPELRKYTTDYINDYFEMGAIGMPFFQHLLFNWEIALKPSQMAQNLTQPLSTTLSSMLKHYSMKEIGPVFTKAYDLTGRYAMYKMDGKRHGISTDMLHYLNKLDRQGELGEQMVKFMQDARTFSTAGFDKVTGSSMRLVEFFNRTQTAVMARWAAIDKVGLTTKDTILAFGKDKISESQFSYGRHNLPTVITGSGNMRDFLRLMYTFRHYQVSNMSRIMGMSPLRGAKMRQWTTALSAALLLHGWKGLAFMGVVGLAWKKVTGHTLDYDVRKTMDEWGVPGKVIDMATVGIPAIVGADISQLVGMGDVIPTYGTPMENILGAPAGFVNRLSRAMYFAQRGDPGRAMEYANPGTIRNVLKGLRYAREGVRTANGTLIATPSTRDIILQMAGFNPLSVTKQWQAEETKRAIQEKSRDASSEFHRRLAWAYHNKKFGEYRRILQEVQEHNMKAPFEQRVRITGDTIRSWVKRMTGKDVAVPRKMRGEFKYIESLYGVKK